MNVCEEAIRSQRDNRVYGKPDRWTQIHLNGGDKIYQVDMGPVYDKSGNLQINSGFFIDEDTYNMYWDPETNTFDMKQYCQDAQIAPYYLDGTYKNHISEYVVPEGGLDVAYGTCENNTAFGEGGCPQIYVGEDSRDQLEKTNHQITPEISNSDRYIGEEKAHDMLEKSYNENWNLAEQERQESSNAPHNLVDQEEGAHNGENNNQNNNNNNESVLPAEGETKSPATQNNNESMLPAEGETKSPATQNNNESMLPAEGETKSPATQNNNESVLPAEVETKSPATQNNNESMLPDDGQMPAEPPENSKKKDNGMDFER